MIKFCLFIFGAVTITVFCVPIVSAQNTSMNRMIEVYHLPISLACCKVDCKNLGIKDCIDTFEREVATVDIREAKRIKIEGRAITRASTTYSHGVVSAIFSSSIDAERIQKQEKIPARSSRLFSTDFDFKGKLQTGQLKILIEVSDWCTILSELSVKVEN